MRWLACCAVLLATPALAEQVVPDPVPPAAEPPATTPPATEPPLPDQDEPEDDSEGPPVAKQEIGPRLGMQIDVGDYGAGGLRLGGDYIYQLSEHWWFDSAASVAFGGAGGECFLTRDPGGTRVCQRGALDGFDFDVDLGLRYIMDPAASGFQPYVRAGVGAGVVSMNVSGVSGLRLGLWTGAGLRRRVHPRVALVGELQLQGGAAFLSDDVGTKRFFEGAVVFGVDFAL